MDHHQTFVENLSVLRKEVLMYIFRKCSSSEMIISRDKYILNGVFKIIMDVDMKLWSSNVAIFLFCSVIEFYFTNTIYHSFITLLPAMHVLYSKYRMKRVIERTAKPFTNALESLERQYYQYIDVKNYYIEQVNDLITLRQTNREYLLNSSLTHQEIEFNTILSYALTKSLKAMQDIADQLSFTPTDLETPYFRMMQLNFDNHLLGCENVEDVVPNFQEYLIVHKAMISYFLSVIAVSFVTASCDQGAINRIHNKLNSFTAFMKQTIIFIDRKYFALTSLLDQRWKASIDRSLKEVEVEAGSSIVSDEDNDSVSTQECTACDQHSRAAFAKMSFSEIQEGSPIEPSEDDSESSQEAVSVHQRWRATDERKLLREVEVESPMVCTVRNQSYKARVAWKSLKEIQLALPLGSNDDVATRDST